MLLCDYSLHKKSEPPALYIFSRAQKNNTTFNVVLCFVQLAQLLPMEENFLLLFRFDNPLESSVEFMKVRHSLVTVRSQVQEGMLIHNINFAQSTSMMVRQLCIYCSVDFMKVCHFSTLLCVVKFKKVC